MPEDATLPDPPDKTQQEIAIALGVQVRRAVELLAGAIGRARDWESGVQQHTHEAYQDAVVVMMRLLFLLFAEDRQLLPSTDPVYQARYSASRLLADLERRAAGPLGEEALAGSGAAWRRLLALFRAVHQGVSDASLRLPAHGGRLFDPAARPWLQARTAAAEEEGRQPPPVDDRTVMRLLQSLRYVAGDKGRPRRRLAFDVLDVELIGHVYEGLLGFDAFRGNGAAAIGPWVAPSARPRFTGAHYTPRRLAEQVVEGALAPLAHSPGPLQSAAAKKWRLRPSAEILGLKIADIAVGSAAFLIAAARYLADRVAEAWREEGDPRSSRRDAVAEARRLVIECCLYGADIDPMAVEMARLSLWLVAGNPSSPFTFAGKLAVGDSLLGITDLGQLGRLDLNPARDGQAAERMLRASRVADLLTGAWLASAARKRAAGDPHTAAARLAHAAAQGLDGAWDRMASQAREWLSIDCPPGSFPRAPLHWPLLFPEVFLGKGGFDAVIGNPPFLGGKKISGAMGSAYREHLVAAVAGGVKGNADLIAYFALRAHALLNQRGQTGLIATNTLAQGDTREVGLDQLVADGVVIRRAVKSVPWPARGAALEYCAVWTSRAPLAAGAPRTADSVAVRSISSSLDPGSRVAGVPRRLAENAALGFQGSIVLGMGFTMQPWQARQLIGEDPRNAEVLFPYLNGRSLNCRPDSSADRWVVDFRERPEASARSYRAVWRWVEQRVRPERIVKDAKAYPRMVLQWWKHWNTREPLYASIARLDRVIVMARVSKTVMPVVVATGPVFTLDVNVFATDDLAMLALLSSAQHYWWAIWRSSTMKRDLRYALSDTFETLPRPDATPELRALGHRLDSCRRALMLARKTGLTRTYNLVHDPACTDRDIAELREIHAQIDHAVARAQGWEDLELAHGFQQTRQGVRYTVGAAAQQEILDRLLELNHERYAAEVAAGLHNTRKAAKAGALWQGQRARPAARPSPSARSLITSG